ncbi:S8 family serine peptidase [Miltoncostaea marina]|uniref:S8 family serine peptidase n=1 Tax=Miltoncostaea marina TaxID=2843215 RepID=UPI001C3D0579|nr:S8 family serine peptidase [Miltoncostaea marina]
MSRPSLRAAALAAVLGALATGAGPAAAGPAKPPEPAAAGAGQAAMARTPVGEATLLVTFADRPGRAAAGRRLAGLGAAAPVLPEAGVWRLVPLRPAAARERTLRRPAVVSAEWSLARRADDRPPPPAPPSAPPAFTDGFLLSGAQWGLQPRSNWGAELTTTGPRPPIAILDSGVDPTHEEWGGPGSPLIAGRSTLRGDADASDHGLSGHGTHVAGIAAAPANGVGVVGTAPAAAGAAPVIPVQIADRAGSSTDETMIRGIRHAVLNGARVINISAGGPGYSRAFQDTILWATRRGALVVASVGNQGQDVNALNYPAAYRRVLGVGAQCDGVVTFDCLRAFGAATFSNRNRSVDVIAPGVGILSSVPRRVGERAVAPGYALKDGTSMAAPYVAGVAALVMGANRNALSPYQVAKQILNTATDTGRRGRDDASGHGIVNPRAAVTLRAPADDASEVNDDVKWLRGVTRLHSRNRPVSILATIDQQEDADDVYAVRLRKGERLRVLLRPTSGMLDLYLWGPGTRTVTTGDANMRRNLLRYRRGTRGPGAIAHRATRAGTHYVNVFARRGGGPYTLRMVRGG